MKKLFSLILVVLLSSPAFAATERKVRGSVISSQSQDPNCKSHTQLGRTNGKGKIQQATRNSDDKPKKSKKTTDV